MQDFQVVGLKIISNVEKMDAGFTVGWVENSFQCEKMDAGISSA